MPRLPVLGVMVGMRLPEPLRPLLLSVSDRCFPVACTAIEPLPDPRPVAYLWAGGSARPRPGSAWAAWVGAVEDLELAVVRDARLLLCGTPALADRAGGRAVLVPAGERAGTHPDARPMPPFVRRRLRAARGLPGAAVALGDGTGWSWLPAPAASRAASPLAPELIQTALGCAAAVVATGPGLAASLAWAAPTVTDPASAAALGAVAGVHVLVDPDERTRVPLAVELAADERTAARLGRQGWLLARDRTDLAHCARTLLRRLGLPGRPDAGRTGILEESMDALGTPPSSRLRARARGLVAPLPAALGDRPART